MFLKSFRADIDECTDNTDDCHADATCVHSAGGYVCHCNEGFVGDGRSCLGVYT